MKRKCFAAILSAVMAVSSSFSFLENMTISASAADSAKGDLNADGSLNADDILISCLTEISQQEEMRIKKLLKTKLSKLGLALNEKKYMRKRFTKDGDFIKYLGVNLVRHKEKNIITVGKAYKNYIAKCYLQYVRMEKDTEGRFFFGRYGFD